MYDECGRRTPLGEEEYFRVAFKTVETEDGAEKLEHYVIHIFRDGTIIFIEDSVVQPPGRAPVVDGMRGKVGFGTSPNCSFDHVIAEFQVPLSITGSSYSPDPLFWGASIPPPPPDCPQGLFERSNALLNNTANCPPPPECPEGSIEVPVLVNVLTGVNEGVAESDEAIQEMLRQANIALGQAGMCLTAALIDREVPDLGIHDGFVDTVAQNRLEDACIREMSFRFGTDIGFKIFLANQVVGPGIDGVVGALGRTEVILPCAFLVAQTPISAGSVLAHEIGHAAGLGHINAFGNLMYPATEGVGTELTSVQQAVLLAAALRRGNSEHSAWTDAAGDVGQAFIDLRRGSLFARSQGANLEIGMQLAGLFPADRAANVKVEALFDSDNNLTTGTTVGSRRGIDKILESVPRRTLPLHGRRWHHDRHTLRRRLGNFEPARLRHRGSREALPGLPRHHRRCRQCPPPGRLRSRSLACRLNRFR